MSYLVSTHNTPFITKGILFRNDFVDSGSLIEVSTAGVTNHTFYTDGDVLTLTATRFISNSYGVALSLTGSPLTNNFAIRLSTGSNITDFQIYFYSGSSNTFVSFNNGFLSPGLPNFNVFTGSINTLMSIGALPGWVDRLVFYLYLTPVAGSSGSVLIDFIQSYNENFPLRYINNSASYSLKKRVIPIDAPMREQQIIQVLGSESPVVDLDGVFISDLDFTAQNYRDKLISVWNEGTYQWLQTDFIGAKFILDNVSIDELPGIPSYYKWTGQFKQYTPISASGQNYNLS